VSAGSTILLVEDDAAIRMAVRRYFAGRGYAVQEADGVESAKKIYRARRPDVAILDYSLPDGDGLQALRELREIDPAASFVMLTAHGSIDLAVQAVKEGAEQFLTKPVELPTLLVVIERVIENASNREASLAGRARQERHAPDPFLGESASIRRLAEQVRRVVGSPSPILIRGESGTGKGLLASWLHRNGPRQGRAFVDLNCAGLTKDLLETELFGHERGAFTGAVSSKPGLLEIADRGTLFLDELGDMDLQIQPKLLKVLEEQRFRRVGEVRDRQVDARLIAATHQDLGVLVEQGRFREDLFYRLNAIPLVVPPLRERGEDVILIARTLLTRIAAELGRPGLSLTGAAERALRSHPWRGNIRELSNTLERAALMSDQPRLEVEALFEGAAPSRAARRAEPISLQEAEKRHIAAILADAGGDVQQAAQILGLSRSALYQKLKKHGLGRRES